MSGAPLAGAGAAALAGPPIDMVSLRAKIKSGFEMFDKDGKGTIVDEYDTSGAAAVFCVQGRFCRCDRVCSFGLSFVGVALARWQGGSDVVETSWCVSERAGHRRDDSPTGTCTWAMGWFVGFVGCVSLSARLHHRFLIV